jgi:transaldolase
LDNKTKAIISIFAGRMADVGKDPVPIIKKSVQITKRKKNVEILWASTREPYNYTQARKLKCQIITAPPQVIEKIHNFGKSFNQLTKDTVTAFLADSRKSKFKI